MIDGSLKVSKSLKKASTAPKAVYKSPGQVETIVRTYFNDIPLLAEIAGCESHFNQYTTAGGVYRGKINASDVGVMQINEKYHLKMAKKMGLDLYNLDGNLAYAKYLYNKEGSIPWISSSACWGNVAAIASNISKN